jgi:magnesium-transporting ATPase (P-type)
LALFGVCGQEWASKNVTSEQKRPRHRERRAILSLASELSAADVPRWSIAEAIASLHSSPRGLSRREAEQRLKAFGRNEIAPHGRRSALAMFLGNLVHILALLLWIAALLAFVGGLTAIGWAILAVILINGVFSFAAPGIRDWLFALLILPLLPLLDEARKLLLRRRGLQRAQKRA